MKTIRTSTTGLRGTTREGSAFPDPKTKVPPMEKWLGQRSRQAQSAPQRMSVPSMAEWQEQRRRAASAPLWRRLIGKA